MRALAGDPLVGQRRFLCTPRSAAAQSLAARCSGACKAVNHGARGGETWTKYLQERDRNTGCVERQLEVFSRPVKVEEAASKFPT